MASITEQAVIPAASGRSGDDATAAPISRRVTARRHLGWLAVGSVMSFTVPFVLADQLGLQRDIYYGIYATAVGGLFLAWARDTGQSVRGMCRRRWAWTIGLGVIFAALS